MPKQEDSVSESGGTPKSAPSASVHLLLLAFSFELRDANVSNFSHGTHTHVLGCRQLKRYRED